MVITLTLANNGGSGILINLTPLTGSNVNVWNGSTWELKPVKVWDGSTWTQSPLKVFTGTSWKTI